MADRTTELPHQERHVVTATRSVQRRRVGRRREDHRHRHVARRRRPIRVIDASGQVPLPRRHRRAHAPRHAVRRHDLGRRFRIGHDRRGSRRHDDDRRLRDSVPGPDAAPRLGNMDEEGGRQSRDRLRLPHDHDRAQRSGGTRDGRARSPGRDVFQAVHGVSRRVHARRCEHFQGADADREERRHDLHARRKRRRDRRADEEGAGRGKDRAEVSRADAARSRRSRSDPPRDRARRNRRRADLHRAPVGRRSARDGHRSARPRPAGLRGNVSAVPVSLLRQLRRTRF